MVYKQYNNELLDWLPREPTELIDSLDALLTLARHDIVDSASFTTDEGRLLLSRALQIPDKIATSAGQENGLALERSMTMNSMLKDLEKLQLNAMNQQEQRRKGLLLLPSSKLSTFPLSSPPLSSPLPPLDRPPLQVRHHRLSSSPIL